MQEVENAAEAEASSTAVEAAALPPLDLSSERAAVSSAARSHAPDLPLGEAENVGLSSEPLFLPHFHVSSHGSEAVHSADDHKIVDAGNGGAASRGGRGRQPPQQQREAQAGDCSLGRCDGPSGPPAAAGRGAGSCKAGERRRPGQAICW